MKNMFSLIKTLFPFLFFFVIISCSEDNVNNPQEYVYEIPEKTNDGWETAGLNEVGITPDKLLEITDIINYGIVKEVHSILLVKEGKLVFEKYFSGHTFRFSGPNHHGDYKEYNRNTIHNQASVTKSFASALIGIAIDQGLISGVDEKVFSFFPEYSKYNTGEKQNLTIEHLLTMSAGFEWNEMEVSYSHPKNDLIGMWNVQDPLEYLIAKPIVAVPGTEFYYNSGLTNLLGEIIYKATLRKPDVFAESYLFSKLGIMQKTWEKFSNGVVFVSGDLKISPRDMAKLGYLYLNEGRWNGQQVISKEWIDRSATKYISANYIYDYGYKWWLRDYTVNTKKYFAYSARGWGGQAITVIPELDLVIVFTGGNYNAPEPVDGIIEEYIIPSVIGF